MDHDNPAWIFQDGIWKSDILAASMGGGKTLLDPWAEIINPSLLEPDERVSTDDGVERRVVGWKVKLRHGEEEFDAYISSVDKTPVKKQLPTI